MEIINVEKEVFDSFKSRFLNFKEQVLRLCNLYKTKTMNDWLDNQDVCMLLNVSPRTLQTYRDTGRIGFSRINHKMFYRVSDVEELLIQNRMA